MNNVVKTALLLGVLSALLISIGGALGGAQGMVFGFFFAVATNFASYWFSDKIVLRMYNATEVRPGHRLYDMVARLAQRGGLPQPRCYVIPDASPNAFATGRNPQHAAVAATEGILQILNDDELAGVLAHELAHVKHRDILISSIAATLAAAIMMISRFAMFFGGGRSDDRQGSNPIALIATIILAPVAAMLIQAAISRFAMYFGGSRDDGRQGANPIAMGRERGACHPGKDPTDMKLRMPKVIRERADINARRIGGDRLASVIDDPPMR